MKRAFAMMMLAMLLLTPCLARAAAPAYAVVNNPNSSDRLNLRLQPDRNAGSLGKYVNGTCVKVLQRQGDWAYVQVGETRGYMMTAYLADPQKPVTSMGTNWKVTNLLADAQWLLSDYDGDMQEMVLVPNGTLVTVFGFADTFAHVQYGGLMGYMPFSSLEDWSSYIWTAAQQEAAVQPEPQPLGGRLVRALLMTGGEEIEITDQAMLNRIFSLLSSRDYLGSLATGCIFGAHLLVEFEDGETQLLELATEGCCIYRHEGHDFRYAYDLWLADEGVESDVLFDLFGWKSELRMTHLSPLLQ